MVRLVLLYVAFMLLAYSFLIRLWPNENPIPQTSWHMNRIKADFFCENTGRHFDFIILGTSLSNILDPSILSDSSLNFSFGGNSAIAGLELMRKYNIHAQYILIETNYFFIETEKWVDKYTNSDLKLEQPIAFYKNKPVVYFVSQCASKFGYTYVPFQRTGTYVDSTIRMESISEYLTTNERELDTLALFNYSNSLKALLSSSNFDESKVIFYTIPYAYPLTELPRYYNLPKYYRLNFNEERYRVLDLVEGEFLTLDGRHLTHDEGMQVMHYLRIQLGNAIEK